MQTITITTHLGGGKAHQAHNRRDPKVVSHEPHIIPNGHFEIWVDEPIEDAYHRIFDPALAAYNAKQTRDSRKIPDYYAHIAEQERKGGEVRDGKSNHKYTAYELIVQVGSVDAPVDKATACTILREYFDDWQERNPHLELVGAYLHDDEQGAPHLHLDFIPVATGYTRGLETQTALDKAFRQQGDIADEHHRTPQIAWEARENECLQSICEEYGLSVEHPMAGRKSKHKSTAAYIADKQAEAQAEATAKAQQEQQTAEAARDAAQRQAQTYIAEAQQEAEEIVAEWDTYAARHEQRADKAKQEAEAAQAARERAERERAEAEVRRDELREDVGRLRKQLTELKVMVSDWPRRIREALEGLRASQAEYRQAATNAETNGPFRVWLLSKVPHGEKLWDRWTAYRKRQEAGMQYRADAAVDAAAEVDRKISRRPPNIDIPEENEYDEQKEFTK